MLSKRHVVMCDEYGSISFGRFIFLAVIPSHDPPHVAYRLEFIFSGPIVGGSRAETSTDCNCESCPHAPDFAETGEIRGGGSERSVSTRPGVP